MTLIEFLERSLRTTKKVNAPFLVVSDCTSWTELRMASTGSKRHKKCLFKIRLNVAKTAQKQCLNYIYRLNGKHLYVMEYTNNSLAGKKKKKQNELNPAIWLNIDAIFIHRCKDWNCFEG